MRRFREIIEDIKAPSPQSLWLDKGELKFFGVKGWTSMVGGRDEDRQELEEKVDSLDKEMGTANNDIKKLQISPNEPYTIQLDSNDIEKPLEDVMASHILNCGEIIVNGVTGPITYTRSVDSTESMIYFISSKKDNSFQILTYNVSSKTITSAISKYAVPAATKSSIGGVKAMTNIADVVNGSTTQDTVDVLVRTVNSLLSQLRAVGLIIN